MTVSALTPFTKIGPDASVQVLSFLDYPDLHPFFRTNHEALALRERNHQRLERTLFSRIEIFDRNKWEECWNVEITDQFDPHKIDAFVLREFLKRYYGPNPIDPSRLVKDTCLIPTVVPAKVNYKGVEHIFNHIVLGELAESTGRLEKQPEKRNYYPARCWSNSEDLKHPHKTAGIEKDNLVIMLQDVVARDLPWSIKESKTTSERGQVEFLEDVNTSTGYGCETEPDALSQNTIVIAHHAVTGKRPLGDESGMEGRTTYGRTREVVQLWQRSYHLLSGDFQAAKMDFLGGLLGEFIPARLEVLHHYAPSTEPSNGVAVLRKFRTFESGTSAERRINYLNKIEI